MIRQLVYILFAILVVNAHQDELASDRLTQAHNRCQNDVKTQISDHVAHQLHSGVFPDDPQVKSHLLCFSQELGLLSKHGELQTNSIREKLSKLKTVQLTDEINEKCLVKKSTPEETAYNLFKCWKDNNVHLNHGGEHHHNHSH